MATKTAWGGRFSQELAEGAARFLASVDVDQRLAEDDIAGSLAHAEMLCAIGVLTADELAARCSGARGRFATRCARAPSCGTPRRKTCT
jgi:argininosuccinate lyase